MNNCYRSKSLLSAYLDRELSGEEMIILRDHLAQCSDCSVEFDELRSVKAALIRIPRVEPAPDLLTRMQAEVFKETEPVQVSRSKVAAGLGMAAAIAFLTLAVLGWVDAQRQSSAIQNGTLPSQGAARVVAGVEQGPTLQPAVLVSAPE